MSIGGKAALITGAGWGAGHAIALGSAKDSAHITIEYVEKTRGGFGVTINNGGIA